MAMLRRDGTRRAAWALGLTAAVLLAAPGVEAKPQTSQSTYRVKSGDSLSVIAERKLRSASQWPRLYALNRRVVGTNPHLIFPGQRLKLFQSRAPLATHPRKGIRIASLSPRVPTPRVKQPHPAPRDPFAMGAKAPAPRVAPVMPPTRVAPPVTPDAPAEAYVPRKAIADGEVVTMPMPKIPADGALPSLPNPWVAAGASLILPGAGQAYVGDWGRGAIYAGAAAAMYGVALYGMQTQNEGLARTGGIGLLGLSVAAPIDAYLGAKHKETQAAAEAVKMGAK